MMMIRIVSHDDDYDDLYIIGRFCLTRKMITLPNGHGFSWFQVGFSCSFYGSRSGFHDARWICIVMNGPRLV